MMFVGWGTVFITATSCFIKFQPKDCNVDVKSK